MDFRTRDTASGRAHPLARINRGARTRAAEAKIARAARTAAPSPSRCLSEQLEERVLFATFTVLNTNNSGGGSLRQAITDSNNLLGADLIVFNIGLGGAATITPTSALPAIVDPVVIDGTSQPGFDPNNPVPLIELSGDNSSGDGFHITGGNTTITGFIISDWNNGIRVDNVGGNTIIGNYIGTDPSGTTDDGNSGDGIQLNIGDNFVGLFLDGTGQPTRDASTANIISGNGDDGIDLNSGGNTVQNNFIGTDIFGTGQLGNGDNGIEIDFSGSTSGNLIGDTYDPNGNNVDLTPRNTIAFNHGSGINILHGINNSILGNVITENDDLGIDIGDDGIDGIDALDVDTGPNDRLNRPIISGAPTVINLTQVNGFINGLPDSDFRIEFYTDFDPDEAAGEGQIFLDFVNVTTDADGRVFFSQQLPIFVPAGREITATATLLDGTGFPTSTSEFAFNVEAGTSPGIGIKGNGQDIVTGSAPDTTTGTDFQSQDIDAGPKTKTFTITNTGSSVLHLTGLTDRVVITDANGDPSTDFVVIDQPSQGSLTPGQSTTFTIGFDPSFVGDFTGTATIENDDPDENPFTFDLHGTGTLKLVSINSATTVEGNSGTHNLDFTVDLSSASPNDITLNYITTDGTASNGSDYFGGSGTVTIPAGSLTGVISIPIVGDTTYERDENFNVTIASLSGDVGVSTPTAVGTITNDDAAPTVTISDVSVAEGQSGVTPVTFTVSLSQAPQLPVVVTYTTADGTATVADGDYQAATNVVTISPGVTSATFTVNVIGDRKVEPNETFFVNLSNAQDGTIVDAQGVATIVNDDRTFTFSGGGIVTETPGGSVATFTVSLDAPSTEQIKVNYGTLNGTATAPSDYTPIGGTLTFAPGETSKTVNVNVAADTLTEGNETFSLGLSNAVNAGVTTTSLTATIRDSLQPFLAFDARSPISYVDASGDPVTISMRGAGQAHLLFATTAGTGDATGLVIDGTTAGSVVAINAGGAGTSVGAISVNRSIKQVGGGNVDLLGNAQFRGTLRQMQLRDLKGNDNTLSVFAVGTINQLSFNSVTDFNITGNSKIKTLQVTNSWLDTLPGTDTISVPTIQTLNVGGDFEADIHTGTLVNGNVKGTMRASNVFVSVGIRALAAGSIADSLIYAGVNDGFTGDIPRADTDFSNDAAYIRQLRTGLFSNSKIAGPIVGQINLGQIQTENNNVLFGVSVDKIKLLTGTTSRGPLSFANEDAPQTHPEDDFLFLVYKDNTPVQRRR